MGNAERFLLNNVLAVEQDVDIDTARTIGWTGNSAKRALNFLSDAQQLLRLMVADKLNCRIQEVRLFDLTIRSAEIDGRLSGYFTELLQLVDSRCDIYCGVAQI